MIEIPEPVRNKARAMGAEAWFDGIPDLIAEIESTWPIEVGTPYLDGTEAYVARAVVDDGTLAVLKLVLPRDSDAADNEATVLRLAEGHGCPELFRYDADRQAILMERLGTSMFRLGLPVETRHRILCDVAAEIWRPAPDSGLPSGADKAFWLADYVVDVWEELDRPCSEEAIEHAVASAHARAAAHHPERAVLVHGDVHQWNALQSANGFKLVDPDGLLAEREYDLGIIMREDPVELLEDSDPRSRARWLANRTGLDEQAIWEWGVVERVSTGLLCTRIDLQPVGCQMLAAADRVAGF